MSPPPRAPILPPLVSPVDRTGATIAPVSIALGTASLERWRSRHAWTIAAAVLTQATQRTPTARPPEAGNDAHMHSQGTGVPAPLNRYGWLTGTAEMAVESDAGAANKRRRRRRGKTVRSPALRLAALDVEV